MLMQMKDNGLEWRVIVSDGGKAIGRALREFTPEAIHQRDVWHVIHEGQKVQEKIDRAVKVLHQRTPAVERNAKRIEEEKNRWVAILKRMCEPISWTCSTWII
jgi:transposase-like protein